MTLLRTGVGSLPHENVDDAVSFVLRTSDVPYLPQLPNRHPQESMLVQWGSGIAGAGSDGPSLTVGQLGGDPTQAFQGAAAMLRDFSGSTLKTQATGPVTLAAALRAGGVQVPNLIRTVTDELLVRISRHLEWIRGEVDVERLVVMIDEPALAALGADGTDLPGVARQALGKVVDSMDAEVGLHCCGDTDWGGLAEIGFDWLSWDLSALGAGFSHGVDRIARAVGAGTRVMWGMVPTTVGPLPDPNVLLARYGTAVANLVVAGAPFEGLKSAAWFTPACGLAGLTVSDAAAVTELLDEVVGEVESGW